MSHKLYTSYLSNMKNIPDGILTVVIMRMPPMSIENRPNTIHVEQLSPSKEVLYAYKKTKDWNTFVEEFNKQMYEDEITKYYLELLMEGLNHNEVAIVCCEKDANQCHRSLIAKYLNELGYESEEI